MKLFRSTKKMTDKMKYGENVFKRFKQIQCNHGLLITWPTYHLDANTERPNDFSLIGRKFCNLSEKRHMVLKFKPKLDLKFKLKGSETIKILKGSKNRRRLKFLFAYR